MKICVINGPNLTMLEKRDKNHYGDLSLSRIEDGLKEIGKEKDVNLDFFASNHEGDIIDKIHSLMGNCDGVIINPAAYTHYSIAIRDAIELVNIPTIEVHLSNIHNREDFRKKSVIAPVCIGQICGLKEISYFSALEAMIRYINKN